MNKIYVRVPAVNNGGYVTRPYTAILDGIITASGNTDVSKHLQEMNSSIVCTQDKILTSLILCAYESILMQ